MANPELLQCAIDELGRSVVIIDADNRLIYVNAKASEELSIPPSSVGAHILDVFKASIILEAIQAARSAPGTSPHSNHNGHAVTVKTFSKAGRVLGVVICS